MQVGVVMEVEDKMLMTWFLYVVHVFPSSVTPPIAQLVERRTVDDNNAEILRSLVQIRLGGLSWLWGMGLSERPQGKLCRKWDSNPRPHSWTRMLPFSGKSHLESGALDRSAIPTFRACDGVWIKWRGYGCHHVITRLYGGPGHRSRYLSHAKRALYHLS